METKTRRKIIAPAALTASDDRLKIVGAFNTGCALNPADQHYYYAVRVAAEPKNHPEGFRLAPRFQDSVLQLDPIPLGDLDPANDDPRGLKFKQGGWRLPFISTLKILKSADGFTFADKTGIDLLPVGADEEFGLEDCRVTRIDDVFYLTYTAVHSQNGVIMPQPNLITTKDFKTFQRHGKIFDGPDKNVVLFPEKIGGDFVALHRPQHQGGADIILTRGSEPGRWGVDSHLTLNGEPLRGKHRGPGAPPLRTERGWLVLTHKRSQNPHGAQFNSPFIYTGHALMLDGDDPTKIIGYLDGPVLAPQEDFEVDGYFGNVVFPTACIRKNADELYVAYGAADEFTGAAIIDYKKLMDRMQWVRTFFPVQGKGSISRPDIGTLDI